MLGELIGSVLGGLFGKSQADSANKMQLDAAKHGVEWRVEDAKKAGIHPLAALGMSPISLNPIAVGDNGAFASAGRAVDQAAYRASPAGLRENEVAKVALEGAQLDNDIKRAELASKVKLLAQPATGPAMPSMITPPVQMGGNPYSFEGPGGFSYRWDTSHWPLEQQVEDDYGDIAGNVYGIGRLAVDASQNAKAFWDRDSQRFAGQKRIVDEGARRELRWLWNSLYGVNPAL